MSDQYKLAKLEDELKELQIKNANLEERLERLEGVVFDESD